MRRGDIVWAQFDPAVGSEASKLRPAVIVSNDASNARALEIGRGLITTVPLTSRIGRLYPSQVLIPEGATELPLLSKVQTEQIRALSIERVAEPIGRMPDDLMAAIDTAIRIHLAL